MASDHVFIANFKDLVVDCVWADTTIEFLGVMTTIFASQQSREVGIEIHYIINPSIKATQNFLLDKIEVLMTARHKMPQMVANVIKYT